MTTVALVPARGGSKGIPRKNLRLIGGRPLIAWSISQALACSAIDQVVVSTEDLEIAAIASEAGATVPFMRPPELAGDETTTEAVMLHAVEALASSGVSVDRVVLLQPTSPVRRVDTIERAVLELDRTRADSVVSVVEVHPFVWRAGEFFEPQYDPVQRPRRQDIPDDQRLYIENGSIYVTSVVALLESRCRISGQVAGFPMSREESIDIDDEIDLALAEAAMNHLGLFS